jgi:hypothetical protein
MEKKNKWRMPIKSSLIVFFLTMGAIAILTTISPAEKTLGEHVRIVYLHGAWVWTSLALFLAAGIFGILGLLTYKQKFHCWSGACGRSAVLFWVTYLPISMWAAQTNWNGIFLSEPRFRMAMIFAVAGILLQLGLVLIANPALTSSANILYTVALFFTLQSTENVMHPPSPMLQSNFSVIQMYFAALVVLMILSAWQITRWLCHLETQAVEFRRR